MRPTSLGKPLLALSAFVLCGSAANSKTLKTTGGYNVVNGHGFSVDTSVNDGDVGSIFDFDASDPHVATFWATTNAAHGGSSGLEGTFVFNCEWTPSYTGQQPSSTTPYAKFQVDAQLAGSQGTASVSANGTTIYDTVATANAWQPVGTVYVQVADELVPFSDGVYRDDIVLDTYRLNCTGSGGNYGKAKLRYTFVGMVDNP